MTMMMTTRKLSAALMLALMASCGKAFIVKQESRLTRGQTIPRRSNLRPSNLFIAKSPNESPIIANVRLFQSSTSESADDGPSFSLNPIPALAWASLLVYVITIAPGKFSDPTDTELLMKILENPTNPDINKLFYTVFNCFATMPIILAALVLPQDSKKGLPAGPFVALASAIGFFAIGPYLAIRPPPVVERSQADLSWATRNIFENKFFGWFNFGMTCLVLVAAGAIPAYQQDPTALWQGFVDLLSTSKFCNVSSIDLVLVHCAITSLIPRDYLLRNPDATMQDAIKIAAATAVFPYVGSALYVALRPSLPEK